MVMDINDIAYNLPGQQMTHVEAGGGGSAISYGKLNLPYH